VGLRDFEEDPASAFDAGCIADTDVNRGHHPEVDERELDCDLMGLGRTMLRSSNICSTV
jgi:hypothetical protein